MAEKIASGEAKEIGTTAARRFARRHPVVTKLGKGAGYVGGGYLLGKSGSNILE
mgnify:CR=1 FL=1